MDKGEIEARKKSERKTLEKADGEARRKAERDAKEAKETAEQEAKIMAGKNAQEIAEKEAGLNSEKVAKEEAGKNEKKKAELELEEKAAREPSAYNMESLLKRVMTLEKRMKENEEQSLKKARNILFLETQLDEVKRNNDILSRKLEKVEIECLSACEERHDKVVEVLEVLGKEVNENVEAVMNTFNNIDDNFRIIQTHSECTLSTIKDLSETLAKRVITLQEEIKTNRGALQLAKKQFQNKMDIIQEDAMKSDKHFEEKFPSLSHATEEKRKNAPGFKASQLKKKANEYAGITRCVSLPVSKETPVWSKYKNKAGKKDRIGRVIEIQNMEWRGLKQMIWPVTMEKTILVVGATGAGKSTLIDGIANFVFNVRFEDNHRLKLINLLKEEEAKKSNQAVSQTDHITVYKIPYMTEGNIPYNLNIIDTPGWLIMSS